MNKPLDKIIEISSQFTDIERVFKEFDSPDFRKLETRKRFKRINKTLLQLIQDTPTPCFLLASVIDFIERVNAHGLLNEIFTLNKFEFWLNIFSKLTPDENALVRGKIAGRYIPRSEYQSIFPIGMNKFFPGTHFVAAHLSPDVDTTVASFWGWLDSFACRVAEGTHQWGLPAIPPDAHLVNFFKETFGKSFFDLVMRKTPSLTMNSMDLITKKDMTKIPVTSHLSSIDHSHASKVLIMVDEKGHFMGEWRNHDAETIRQIASLFCSVLRWFESLFIAKISRYMAKERLKRDELAISCKDIYNIQLKVATPIEDATDKQKKLLSDFLKKILGLKGGVASSFEETLSACDTLFETSFSVFHEKIEALIQAQIFDSEGFLNNSRTDVMGHFEAVISAIETAVLQAYQMTDRLDVMLQIRDQVLGQPSLYVTLKSDIEEMRNKIGSYDFLPVVISEEEGQLFPVGIVRATDLKKSVLGTASLRDFSNLDESKLASYIEVISIIDHHKTSIKTSSASTFTVADAQSSNTLVAELSLAINDRYRSPSSSTEDIKAHLQGLLEKPINEASAEEIRHFIIAQSTEALRAQNGYFVHPQRECIEYLTQIFAILDDTDLLSKVSTRDVLCVKSLVNRMNRLSGTSKDDFIDFSDIANSPQFPKMAAARLVQNRDIHSIYSQLYKFKESEVEKDLLSCSKNNPSNVFADTKEQNGCCRIGQTKLFSMNYPTFEKLHDALLQIWISKSQSVLNTTPQIDFFLHMISTIPGAEEVYQGEISWSHQDELWIWVPKMPTARERLISFLNGFNSCDAVQGNTIEVELFGHGKQELESIFEQNFPRGKIISNSPYENGILAILKFKAGLINSRKSQISPYLPKFVP